MLITHWSFGTRYLDATIAAVLGSWIVNGTDKLQDSKLLGTTMKTSKLLSYSTELIHSIGEELDLPDVKHLRLVCRVLADALACIVLRKLTFEVYKKNMAQGMDMIETLATAESDQAAYHAVREISIGLLSSSYDPSNMTITRYEGGAWVTEPPPKDPPEVTNAEESLKNNLFAAITSLRGVYSVQWKTDDRNQPFVHRTIIDAIKALPNLRYIKIVFSRAEVPLELDLLRGREKIAVSTEQSTALQQEEIFDTLAKAIAQNPTLASLDVRGVMHHGEPISNDVQSLHQLFKYYPATLPPLRLRELRLKSMIVCLDQVTMPHLTHLTTLHLEEIDEPTEKTSSSFFQRFGRSISAGLSKDRKQFTEDIWNVLRNVGIRLQNITVTSVPSSFLDYLSSYSGLERLDIMPYAFQDRESSDSMAARFYDGRLNSHARSLKSLRIKASFEGLWCFGKHNVKTISSLTNLRSLGMSIRYADLGVSDDPSQDAIKDLIDLTLDCMPNIQSIEVTFARLEMDRNAFCGTGSMQYARFVYDKMLQSVGNYVSPHTCKRSLLPPLTVGSETVFLSEPMSMDPDDISLDGGQLGDDTTTGTGGGRLWYVNKMPHNDGPHWLAFI